MSHLAPQQLKTNLDLAQEKIQLGTAWQHYKTKYSYTILGFDIDSETDQVRVHYKPTYMVDGIVFSHSVNDFLKEIEIDGKLVKRFAQIYNE